MPVEKKRGRKQINDEEYFEDCTKRIEEDEKKLKEMLASGVLTTSAEYKRLYSKKAQLQCRRDRRIK